MEPESTRKLSRPELASFIEVEGIHARLGWKDRTGDEVLAALGVRGLAPPHQSARKRTPGSGRSIVYLPEARDWVLELALRVEQHGWAWARAPMLLRRRAVLSDCTLAARTDRPLVELILDRAVCDLLNLQARTVEGLAAASERLVLSRGAPSQVETPLTQLLEANRQWTRGSDKPASEALEWGPALVLAPQTKEGARAFLGTDPGEFLDGQRQWQTTIESIFQHGSSPAETLAERHGVNGLEDHHVFAAGFPFLVLPETWEKFLRWRLSWLVHRRPARGARGGLLSNDIPAGPVEDVIGMTKGGAFGIRNRATDEVVQLSALTV